MPKYSITIQVDICKLIYIGAVSTIDWK